MVIPPSFFFKYLSYLTWTVFTCEYSTITVKEDKNETDIPAIYRHDVLSEKKIILPPFSSIERSLRASTHFSPYTPVNYTVLYSNDTITVIPYRYEGMVSTHRSCSERTASGGRNSRSRKKIMMRRKRGVHQFWRNRELMVTVPVQNQYHNNYSVLIIHNNNGTLRWIIK